MPSFESTILLLGVPIAAWVLGLVIVASAYGDLKARGDVPRSGPALPGRVTIFYAVSATPAVFGFVLWMLSSGLEADYGPITGIPGQLAFSAAASFAVVAAVVVGVQTWISHSRIAQFASEDFGRVLPLVVIPETGVIFALLLAFLTLGIIGSHLDGTEALTEARAARAALGLQVYALSTLAYPIGAFLSNRIRDLSTARRWTQALSRLEAGAIATIAGFVWGFLQLGSQ